MAEDNKFLLEIPERAREYQNTDDACSEETLSIQEDPIDLSDLIPIFPNESEDSSEDRFENGFEHGFGVKDEVMEEDKDWEPEGDQELVGDHIIASDHEEVQENNESKAGEEEDYPELLDEMNHQ